MQENNLFEYALIRVVPRVEREEFLNAGVILYCQKLKYLGTKILLDKDRLNALCKEVDIEEVEKHLHSFERICQGTPDAGPIGKLDKSSRFRWLAANRSTIIQTSRVHPGLCNDPQEKLEKLFKELVL
jgi:hypothetical protein